MGSEKSAPAQAQRHAVAFTSGREADRRVAGVAAAARMVHGLAQSGAGETWPTSGDGATLAPAPSEDFGLARIAIVHS